MSDLGCCGLEHHQRKCSLGVIVYGYDGLPTHLVDPSSTDYVPGPEEPKKEVPVKDQPYVVADLPIALSSGYIADSDPKEDLEDESEDGPTDYPVDGDDDDDGDSLRNDADDEDKVEASEDEEDEEEDEEHLAPANSTTAASLVVDPIPFAEETQPFKTDEYTATPPPPLAYRTTARMSILAQTPIPFLFEAEVDRLIAIPTLPPSPLTSLSSPLPRIPLPSFHLRTTSPRPLPLSLPLPLSPPIILPGTRASMVLMRASTSSTYILVPRSRTPPSGTRPILPITLPTSSLSLPLPSTDHIADVLKAMFPPQKRLYIALDPKFKVEESSSAIAARSTERFRANYGSVGTLDVEIRCDLDRELNVLHRDRCYHANTNLLVEREARVARKAWAQSMDASHMACFEVMILHTKVGALQTQIVILQRQRTEDSDRLTQHIQHEHDRFREFQRTRDVAPEGANSSS
nr:hypothetical protein [Tanacetum cinerariifolium]